MTLSDFLAIPGAVEHDGGRKPDNWDGGAVLLSDGDIGIPPGWAWAPFNDLQVIAYIPENTNG